MLKSALLFQKIANFTGKLLQNYKFSGKRNFRDIFDTRQGSYISAFSICMTVPLNIHLQECFFTKGTD